MTAKSAEETPESQSSSQEDAAWVRLARAGDTGAYEKLIRKHQGKIYGLIYNMTGNNADTEDLVQEVFVKAYQALGRFKGQSSFYTWLYRIAVNRTLNFVKKRNNRATFSLNDVDPGIETDPTLLELATPDNPSRDAMMTDIQEKLNKALQSLSEKHRAVVVLHDVQGVPHEEIAKMLGCSSGTVRSRLFYARQQLQCMLSEYAL